VINICIGIVIPGKGYHNRVIRLYQEQNTDISRKTANAPPQESDEAQAERQKGGVEKQGA
jgi:hypothetical protein